MLVKRHRVIQSRRDPLLAGLRPMKLCLTFKAPRGIQSQCLTEILPWCCVEQKPALEAPANVLAILWMVAAICTGVPAQDRGCLPPIRFKPLIMIHFSWLQVILPHISPHIKIRVTVDVSESGLDLIDRGWGLDWAGCCAFDLGALMGW